MRNVLGLLCMTTLAVPVLSPPRAVAASPRLVHFEPEQVKLVGTLHRKTFLINPGSGREGRESHYVLALDESVEVATARGDDRTEVDELQVASRSEDWLESYHGRRVRLTGTLFPGHTRHHFTRVMVFAHRAEPVR
jgi:hypothetical protein